MPYYDYGCTSCGRVTTRREGYDVAFITCSCGEAAIRAPYGDGVQLIGDTVPKHGARPGMARDRHGRVRLDIFQEASAEVAHAYDKAEQPQPNLYKAGMAEAKRRGAPIRDC